MYSYFVGIDIAKNTHWASILSSYGEIISEPFSFFNGNLGFQKLISKLHSLQKEKILIGLNLLLITAKIPFLILFSLVFSIGLIPLFKPLTFTSLTSGKLRMIRLIPK